MMNQVLLGPWRMTGYDEDEANGIEMAWRKSSRSENESACVELANVGAVRDSKNPDGGILRVDLSVLLAELRVGRFDR